jgi:hypothetical protein
MRASLTSAPRGSSVGLANDQQRQAYESASHTRLARSIARDLIRRNARAHRLFAQTHAIPPPWELNAGQRAGGADADRPASVRRIAGRFVETTCESGSRLLANCACRSWQVNRFWFTCRAGNAGLDPHPCWLDGPLHARRGHWTRRFFGPQGKISAESRTVFVAVGAFTHHRACPDACGMWTAHVPALVIMVLFTVGLGLVPRC